MKDLYLLKALLFNISIIRKRIYGNTYTLAPLVRKNIIYLLKCTEKDMENKNNNVYGLSCTQILRHALLLNNR